MIKQLLLIITLLNLVQPVSARGTYQEPADFISETFNGNNPNAQVVQLTDDLRKQIETILQHKHKGQRIRFWQQDKKTAWILNETGKKKPITTGIVIENNRISKIKVLVFRESRGWEVKHDFFTQQFNQASLTENNKLDRNIDGISGATLSVRALTKQAKIALLLHKTIMQP